MAVDVSALLDEFVTTIREHYRAASDSDDPDSATVLRAEKRLLSAFERYDDALFTRYGVELPFESVDEDSDEDYDTDYDEED
ncbi:MAG: DNA primase [Varibaculum sp.]|nr:DNA primase [Varibaculum sp.]